MTFNDTDASLFLLISNQDDGSGGGTIASDAMINLNAGAVSIGGAAFAEISNMLGGTIGGNAAINVNISGDLLTAGDAVFDILNEGAFDTGGNGGTINGNASIIFNAANIAINGPNGLDVSIFNGFGGDGDNAIISLNAADISLTGFFSEITIDNDNGARIGGDAMMTVNAASLSAVDSSDIGFFFAGISNEGGTIAGMAATTYAISGDLTVQRRRTHHH